MATRPWSRAWRFARGLQANHHLGADHQASFDRTRKCRSLHLQSSEPIRYCRKRDLHPRFFFSVTRKSTPSFNKPARAPDSRFSCFFSLSKLIMPKVPLMKRVETVTSYFAHTQPTIIPPIVACIFTSSSARCLGERRSERTFESERANEKLKKTRVRCRFAGKTEQLSYYINVYLENSSAEMNLFLKFHFYGTNFSCRASQDRYNLYPRWHFSVVRSGRDWRTRMRCYWQLVG